MRRINGRTRSLGTPASERSPYVRHRTVRVSIFEDAGTYIFQENFVKIWIIAAAALPLAFCVNVQANEDEASYNQRAAQTDMALFRELNRAGNGALTKEEVRGDMRLGTRFDDIDTNRDEIVTPQEMKDYIEKTYRVIPAPG
jgi:hypothetical protein